MTVTLAVALGALVALVLIVAALITGRRHRRFLVRLTLELEHDEERTRVRQDEPMSLRRPPPAPGRGGLTAPAGPPPWSPAALTNLALWYDAADDASLTLVAGQQVASWADKSPNGYTLTPPGGPSSGVARTGTIGGLPAVVLTNVGAAGLSRPNVNLQTLVAAANRVDCMTLAVLIQAAGNVGAPMCQGATYRVNYQYGPGGGNYMDIPDAGGGRLSGALGQPIGATPFLVAGYRNGPNMAWRLNGATILSKANATGTIATPELGTIGFGSWSGTCSLTVAELLHVTRYDAADLSSAEQYLTGRWLS